MSVSACLSFRVHCYSKQQCAHNLENMSWWLRINNKGTVILLWFDYYILWFKTLLLCCCCFLLWGLFACVYVVYLFVCLLACFCLFVIVVVIAVFICSSSENQRRDKQDCVYYDLRPWRPDHRCKERLPFKPICLSAKGLGVNFKKIKKSVRGSAWPVFHLCVSTMEGAVWLGFLFS